MRGCAGGPQASKVYPALKVRSELPAYSEMYTLYICDPSGRQLASMTHSVARYFTQVSVSTGSPTPPPSPYRPPFPSQ